MDDSTTLRYIRAVLDLADRHIEKYTDEDKIKAVKIAAYDSIKDIMKGEKEDDV